MAKNRTILATFLTPELLTTANQNKSEKLRTQKEAEKENLFTLKKLCEIGEVFDQKRTEEFHCTTRHQCKRTRPKILRENEVPTSYSF